MITGYKLSRIWNSSIDLEAADQDWFLQISLWTLSAIEYKEKWVQENYQAGHQILKGIPAITYTLSAYRNWFNQFNLWRLHRTSSQEYIWMWWRKQTRNAIRVRQNFLQKARSRIFCTLSLEEDTKAIEKYRMKRTTSTCNGKLSKNLTGNK